MNRKLKVKCKDLTDAECNAVMSCRDCKKVYGTIISGRPSKFHFWRVMEKQSRDIREDIP